MLKPILFLLSFLAVTPAIAQAGNGITIGHTDSVFSKTLNEPRKLWIYVPESNNKDARSPVLYLLDGDDLFLTAASIVSHLGESNSNSVIPDMIIVGIGNTDRTRDLTPTHDPEHKTSGGAEKFTTFIEKELIPYVDNHYPTVPHRVLTGHSFAGLFVMNTVSNHPTLFNSYLALDPSVWWNKMQPLKQIQANIGRQNFGGQKLFIGLSNLNDTAAARKDTTNATIATRSHLGVRDVFQHTSNKSVNFRYKYFPDETHGTLPMPGIYDGLKAIFDFYKRPSFSRIGERGFNADSLLNAHYTNVSKQMGYTILPPESLVSGLAWLCSMRNMPKEQLQYYKLNLTNYPKSVQAHLQLGEYYEQINDKKAAIDYYTKALALQEDRELRNYIKELKGK
ncbi:MAG: alpha/beta hydrolase [Sphingobacteriales bacterium]|nr:MAG: alpha/beta hydrolase [Sphingobacteriales bacterium]